MTERDDVSRRSILKGAALAGAAGLALGHEALTSSVGAVDLKKKGKVMKYKNSDFYQNGVFQEEKAKQAYFDLMKRFNYPIPKPLREGLWVLDFALGDFVNVGMGGIFWWNNMEQSYFGHEIFLLPGQMILEHSHVRTEKAKPKMEAWHVRHGMIHTLGDGEATIPMPIKLPESQWPKFITCRNCQPLMPGEVRELNRLLAKHFMIGGPEGAIVSEYATAHDNDGLRFTNPKAKL